jgi:hypothetical protein
MNTVKEFFAHPLIQMALVLGVITLVLSHFSKRVFDEPLRNWELGLPALIAMLFQGFSHTKKSSRFSRTWIGILLVVLSAVLILVLNG